MSGVCPAHLNLPSLVSAPRFKRYRDYAADVLKKYQHEVEPAAARLYMWNAVVAAAYMPSIAVAEVVIRNSMNRVICEHFDIPTSRGWHTLALPAYGDTRLHLKQLHVDELQSSYDKLARRFSRDSERVHDTPNGDDMVGGSSLGSWMALTEAGEARDARLNYHDNIWVPYLHKAFPNLESDSRGTLRGTLREFQDLRNKCAHHEPLLHDETWHVKKVKLITRLVAYVDQPASDYIRDTEGVAYAVGKLEDYLDGDCYL